MAETETAAVQNITQATYSFLAKLINVNASNANDKVM